jgi:Uma2 family endonuclease
VLALLPIDAETPRSLVLNPSLTDAEFEALSLASEWFSFERTREGEILMHPPAGGLTSGGNAEIAGQLHLWWKTTGEEGCSIPVQPSFFPIVPS